MSDETSKLVADCLAGDAASQRQLYDQYYRKAYRLAVRMVGRQDAADLTQQVFLRVFTGLKGFRGQAAFSTWLYRIVINECLRHRRNPSSRTVPLTREPLSAAATPDQRLERAELLERALDQLEERLRAVFLLREAEGLTYNEIAAVLGIPPGTVASQLSRARTELRAFLQRVEQGR